MTDGRSRSPQADSPQAGDCWPEAQPRHVRCPQACCPAQAHDASPGPSLVVTAATVAFVLLWVGYAYGVYRLGRKR